MGNCGGGTRGAAAQHARLGMDAAVLPSLVALAGFVPWALGWQWPEPSLAMLSGALLVSLGVDARLGPLVPRWWMPLRVPLSFGLGLMTMAVAVA